MTDGADPSRVEDGGRSRRSRVARQKVAAAESFGGSAEGYRSSEIHREGSDLDRIAAWCTGSDRALDVATGAGHTARALLREGVRSVVALDAAPTMVETTLDATPTIAAVIGDAERLPFEADTFDAVSCRIAAHHFPAPEAFIGEVARVLRPGGTFAFEDNVVPENTQLAAYLNELERLRDPTHVASHRLSTWCEWLEAVGFVVEEQLRHTKPLAFEPWVARMGALDRADVDRIRRHFREAPRSAVEAFGIELEAGEPVSFASMKGLIRAVLVD